MPELTPPLNESQFSTGEITADGNWVVFSFGFVLLVPEGGVTEGLCPHLRTDPAPPFDTRLCLTSFSQSRGSEENLVLSQSVHLASPRCLIVSV